MVEKSGMKVWIAAGVALLMAVAIVPALSGAGHAAPITTAATSPSDQWSYGGQGWSNGSLQFGNSTVNWTGVFGWTVTFTVTNTSAGVWMIEEQRTVGATFTLTLQTPERTAVYYYHAQEVDTAFANVTNDSTVYVNGAAVPAIGILNASATVNSLVEESAVGTFNGHTRSAYLNVTGTAHADVSFSPSLGLIPLNLTGVDQWNSTSTATSAAAWSIDWAWSDQGFNGTVRSGSGSANGSLSGTSTVSVSGMKVPVNHVWTDGKTRVGIVLIVQGPFDCYDGFILVPHAFDFFGGAPQGFNSLSFASSSISSEDLYVSAGPGGHAVTAASQTFGSSDSVVTAQPESGVSPAASNAAAPGTTVMGEPISSSQAAAINRDLTNSGAASSPASGTMSSGLLVVGVAIAVIAVIVGTVGVIEWRSYSRRRSKGGLVGGYGESWPNGVPPAAANSPGATAPPATPSGPGSAQDPNAPR